MLNLDYGSGSEDEDTETSSIVTAPKPTATLKSTLAASLPPPTKASSLALPPPSKPAASRIATSVSKAKKTKKIAIGLPELGKSGESDEDEDVPPAKKPRLETGAGVSSLLSMLPAPKVKNPTPAPAPRVLGGGGGPGLVFNASSSRPSLPIVHNEDAGADEDTPSIALSPPKMALSRLLPPSLAKGRSNVNVEDVQPALKVTARPAPSAPAVDFFSLGATSASASTPNLTSTVRSAVPTLSSAPKVDDFKPPEPTQNDPYPGYYQLPSGNWAAYDPDYYKSFYNKWKKQYDAHVRALERGERGFEDYDADVAGEVDAAAEMERAKVEVQELEERKALTKGGQDESDKPRMNIQGAKLGGRARSRHQLTTLLTEAYQNRETLEEKIAQAKRNRKEAGQKYGF